MRALGLGALELSSWMEWGFGRFRDGVASISNILRKQIGGENRQVPVDTLAQMIASLFGPMTNLRIIRLSLWSRPLYCYTFSFLVLLPSTLLPSSTRTKY